MSERRPRLPDGAAAGRRHVPPGSRAESWPIGDPVLMNVADVRLLEASDGSPMERCQVVLTDMHGRRSIDLWCTRSVAEWTASALRGVEVPWGSSPYHLSLQYLRANKERLAGVLLETLKDGTLRGVVRIAGERHTRDVAARAADSVTLALLSSAPIYVAPYLLGAPESPKPSLSLSPEAAAKLKGSSELAIDLFERQEAWDPMIDLPPSGPPVHLDAIGKRVGPSWRSDVLPRRLAELLDAEVARIIEEHRLVGLAIALVWEGNLAYFRSLGVRDANSFALVTERTVFPIMSVTKTVTALAVMQLCERGLFGLDDPADHYVKTIEIRRRDRHSAPVTIRRLLTHTHGIVDEGRVYIVPQGEQLPTVLEFFSGGVIAAGRADEPWRYGQDGFAILGQLVEEVSGQSLRDYVVEHVFDPLGMGESDFQHGSRLRQERAAGYERDLLGVYAFGAPPWTMVVPAIGLGYSTVQDLSRYAAALSGRMPAEVLKADTLAAMFEPQVVVPVRWPAHFGLGFNLRRVHGAHAVGQNGGTGGFMTVVWAVPGRNLAIVMCTNTSGAPGLEREPPETLLPLALADY